MKQLNQPQYFAVTIVLNKQMLLCLKFAWMSESDCRLEATSTNCDVREHRLYVQQ